VPGLILWAVNVRDAHRSAGQINRGEVVIRHSMSRQAVHVLASQLLGNIPFIGIFFPPGIVAEAIDSLHKKRGPDRARLVREGGQAIVEWAVTRTALWGLWIFMGVWVIWWILRAFRLAP
jgi:hypothetical protein